MKLTLLTLAWLGAFILSFVLGFLVTNEVIAKMRPPDLKPPCAEDHEELKERLRQVEGWTEWLAKGAGFDDVCLGSEQCPEPSDPVPPWRKEE